jgi:Cu+-exporting ATPase
MFTLVGLGVGVSRAYSVVATAAPGVFPAAFGDAHGQVGVYYEAGAVIVTLVLLAQVLEMRSRSRGRAAEDQVRDIACGFATTFQAAVPHLPSSRRKAPG